MISPHKHLNSLLSWFILFYFSLWKVPVILHSRRTAGKDQLVQRLGRDTMPEVPGHTFPEPLWESNTRAHSLMLLKNQHTFLLSSSWSIKEIEIFPACFLQCVLCMQTWERILLGLRALHLLSRPELHPALGSGDGCWAGRGGGPPGLHDQGKPTSERNLSRGEGWGAGAGQANGSKL